MGWAEPKQGTKEGVRKCRSLARQREAAPERGEMPLPSFMTHAGRSRVMKLNPEHTVTSISVQAAVCF